MCPERKIEKGPRPNITGLGSKEKDIDRYEPWNMPDISKLTNEEKRKLLTIALKIALKMIMKNHIYKFGEDIKRQ